MSNRAFIVKIKKNFGARAIQALIDQIHTWRGKLLLLADGGFAMVVNLDDTKQDAVRKLPQVALVGGVDIKPREIKRIRVDSSGRPISKQPQQGD